MDLLVPGNFTVTFSEMPLVHQFAAIPVPLNDPEPPVSGFTLQGEQLTRTQGQMARRLADQLNNQDHQRNDQQNVYVRSKHVEPNTTEQPEYQQHRKICPKHVLFLLTV